MILIDPHKLGQYRKNLLPSMLSGGLNAAITAVLSASRSSGSDWLTTLLGHRLDAREKERTWVAVAVAVADGGS
jgi:hypothetical protein